MSKNRQHTARTILNAFVMIGLVTGPLAAGEEAASSTAGVERRYLAVDPSLHRQLKGVELVMGQAEPLKRIFTSGETDWEREHGLELGFIAAGDRPSRNGSARTATRRFAAAWQSIAPKAGPTPLGQMRRSARS